MTRHWKGAVLAIFWLIVAVNAVWWATYGAMAHARGDYAGMSYGDAKNDAIKAMQLRYGGEIAAHLRFGVPDVKNTHINSASLGRGQVRIFHFIGLKGQRYCVFVNESTSTKLEANAIAKGCRFR